MEKKRGSGGDKVIEKCVSISLFYYCFDFG